MKKLVLKESFAMLNDGENNKRQQTNKDMAEWSALYTQTIILSKA